MKRLVLMRHAKSSWNDAALPDHERPLNMRGRLAASLMGAWLAEQPWRVDAVVVSTSRRTRESWDRLAAMIDRPPSPTFDRTIYEAPTTALLAALNTTAPEVETLLMLGHNPGMEDFAAMLAAPSGPRPARFATAAAAVFETDLDWPYAEHGDFRLIAFETPKSLV